MKVLTKKEDCENILSEKHRSDKIIGHYSFKKILNDYFSPDRYFFVSSSEEVLPLVIKNNVAYFYGGNLPYNDYNFLPEDSRILKFGLNSLEDRDIKISLTSIVNDPIHHIDPEYRNLDVPYNQNWIYKNIFDYTQDSLINSIKVKKKRDKVKRAIKKATQYKFLSIDSDQMEEKYLDMLLEMSIKSFEDRGKLNSWKEHKTLYREIYRYFFKNFKCINRILLKDNYIVGSYSLVIGEKECFLAFCNNFVLQDENVPYILYLDALKTSKENCSNEISFFNAGRGSFAYKKRLSLLPVPMYALVNTKSWKVSINKDLTLEETEALYGRKFYALGGEE